MKTSGFMRSTESLSAPKSFSMTSAAFISICFERKGKLLSLLLALTAKETFPFILWKAFSKT